jgi:hypothetical protein
MEFNELSSISQSRLISFGLDPTRLITFNGLWLYYQNTAILSMNTVSGCGQTLSISTEANLSSYVAYFLGLQHGIVGHHFRMSSKDFIRRKPTSTIKSYQKALAVIPGLTIIESDVVVIVAVASTGASYKFKKGIYEGDEMYKMISSYLLPRTIAYDDFVAAFTELVKIQISTEFVSRHSRKCSHCQSRIWHKCYYPCLHAICAYCGNNDVTRCPFCGLETDEVRNNTK